MTVDMASGAGELYDLVADPEEVRNLFDDPAASDVRRELEAMLASRPNDAGPVREPVGMA